MSERRRTIRQNEAEQSRAVERSTSHFDNICTTIAHCYFIADGTRLWNEQTVSLVSEQAVSLVSELAEPLGGMIWQSLLLQLLLIIIK